MLRICKNGKKKYQSLGISINPKFWDFSKNEPTPNCPNRDYIKKIILDKQAELQTKILELNTFRKSYTAQTLIDNKKIIPKTVKDFYNELITGYEAEGKMGNRDVYLDSYNSLKTFTKGKLDILFDDIDVNWLNKYEAWLRSKNLKETSISVNSVHYGLRIIKL